MDPSCLQFALTPKEREHLQEQGYLVVAEALDKAMTSRLIAAVDRVDARERTPGHCRDRLLSFANILPEDDAFVELIDWPRVFPKVWGLLGWNIYVYITICSPGSFSEVSMQPGNPSAKTCPSCSSVLLEGAIACMDCGFLLQGDGQAAGQEGPPNLCTNPACGVANPPGVCNCQRCDTPLPVAGGALLNNRYRVDKLLAMGGFGAVYKATDTKAGNREVAIKDVLSGDPQEFSIRLHCFLRAAGILRSLQAVPIVPRVHDIIHQGQSAYLVMEFIHGADLLTLMEKNGNKPFPIPLVVEWGKAICDLLEHMHRQSPPLIHRNLRPDDIILLEDRRSIKMIGFDTVRDLGKAVKEQAAGEPRVYTAGYAPPEQIVGKPEPRSDLYALAATLYHLATGEWPEGLGAHPAVTLEDRLNGPNARPPGLPRYRWFYEVLKANLAEDVRDRYASAQQVKAALQRQGGP
jgi:hypothetical protein